MIPANNHPEIDRLIHLKNHLGVQPLSSSTAVSRSGNTLRYMVYPSFLRR